MGKPYKRGRIWWIAYTVNGKQRCESAHTTNKRLAEKLQAVREAEIFEGRFHLPASRPPVFSDYAQDYLANVPHWNTRRAYRGCINSLEAHFGHLRLNEVT